MDDLDPIQIESNGASNGNGHADLRRGKRQRHETAARAADTCDRLPPHSIEAEQGVMGCIFLSPNDCLSECIATLKAGSRMFYDLKHQDLYDLLVAMFEKKEAIDTITVYRRLQEAGQLEKVGGLSYISTLPDTVPSAANLSHYLSIVREKYTLRRYIQEATDRVSRIYNHTGEIDVLMDDIEKDTLSIRSETEPDGEMSPVRDTVNEVISDWDQCYRDEGRTMGLKTGLIDFDKMTFGMMPADMYVVAARPSVGKTSLAMTIAEHVAIDQDKPVGIFSLEMSKRALISRMISSRARVNLRNIREGFLADREFPKLTAAAGTIASRNLWINDTRGTTILQLRAKARRMKQQHGIELIIIDYLQLLHSSTHQAKMSREREIAEVSEGIKIMAGELNLPVLVLCQLNREVDKRKSGRPMISDLRESGAIEQDADLIGLLYRRESDEQHDGVAVDLEIAKQRNGDTGVVHLTFLKSYTRFESAAKISADDVPSHDI